MNNENYRNDILNILYNNVFCKDGLCDQLWNQVDTSTLQQLEHNDYFAKIEDQICLQLHTDINTTK